MKINSWNLRRLLNTFLNTLLDKSLAHIIAFDTQFDKLGISKINKIHAIVTHVPEFIKMTGKPLGIFSEQAMESVHHDFAETWKDYHRGEIAQTFHEQLHKCVVKYNSMHL